MNRFWLSPFLGAMIGLMAGCFYAAIVNGPFWPVLPGVAVGILVGSLESWGRASQR